MRFRRRRPEIDERQQLILSILLIIILSISILYCLGIASLVARQTWQDAPLPWSETQQFEEGIDLTVEPLVPVPSPSATTP